MAYDAVSRLIVSNFEYDDMDRLMAITDALGNTTSYSYDAMGRLSSTTNANLNTTSYT